jgi:integrase
LCSFCVVKRNQTQKSIPNAFNKVFDGRNRRVRGLWERNGVYYAQVRAQRWRGRVALEHAKTVAQAGEEWQALKTKIREGKFIPLQRPAKGAQNQANGALTDGSTPRGSPASPIDDAVAGYKHDRDRLKLKGLKTRRHENGSFNAWSKYAGKRPLSDIDGTLLKDFAAWRMDVEDTDEEPLSGRTVNLNVLALKHAVTWAVVERWLPKFPENWVWEDLPEKPKPVRLIEPEELDFLRHVRLIDPEALEMIDSSRRHIAEVQQTTGQAFSDYVYLLALTGGREQETIAKRWSHVIWKRRVLHFPGALAKAGGGKPAEDRDVDFHEKLEAHLKDMFNRRDTSTDYMFPVADGGHISSYRKQWEHAREALKQWHIKNGKNEEFASELCDTLGFHHLRHYFISHCVMAGIDYMTIALWVCHRDGGVLIGKKYGHLRPGHSAQQAQKLNSVAAF